MVGLISNLHLHKALSGLSLDLLNLLLSTLLLLPLLLLAEARVTDTGDELNSFLLIRDFGASTALATSLAASLLSCDEGAKHRVEARDSIW